jgi:hypothetical protein
MARHEALLAELEERVNNLELLQSCCTHIIELHDEIEGWLAMVPSRKRAAIPKKAARSARLRRHAG